MTNPKEKEPTTEPLVIHELNVSEGQEAITDYDWNEVTTDQQNF